MMYQNHLWYPSPTLNVLNLLKKTKQCLVFVIKHKKTLFFCVLWSIHEHSISGAGQDEGGMVVCLCKDWPWRATLCRIHWIAAPWVKVALEEWNHLGPSLPWRITLAWARDESSQTFFFCMYQQRQGPGRRPVLYGGAVCQGEALPASLTAEEQTREYLLESGYLLDPF